MRVTWGSISLKFNPNRAVDVPVVTGKGGVDALVKEIRSLENNPGVRRLVDERVEEFLNVKEQDSSSWFTELVYCLLTAYSSAEMGQSCVDGLKECDFILRGGQADVSGELRRRGHRFADRRAEYIVATRDLEPKLKGIIQGFGTSSQAREWLVENVKGLGMKEASHFLRNVGYLDVAILDRHVISNMVEFGLIESRGKSLTKRRYLEYEKILKGVAERLNMPVGKLDLYLWYRKTGKVLK